MRQILSVCGLCAMNAIFLIQNARVVMQLKERLFGQRNPLQIRSVLYTNVQSLITIIIVVGSVLNFPVRNLST